MALFALAVAAGFIAFAYGLHRLFPGTIETALRWFTRLRWGFAALTAILFAFFALSSGITFLIVIGAVILAIAALYYFAFGLDGAMP